MLEIVDFQSQEIQSYFPSDCSEYEISPLVRAINKGDFDEFVRLIDTFDLNQVYDHEDFPEPQRLSQYLLFRFLAFIGTEEEGLFPNGFPNGAEFIQVVLERKPDLTFYFGAGFSFAEGAD